MITERGTIKAETTFDGNVNKEFLHNIFIISVVSLVVGAAGIVAYMAWDISTVFYKNLTEPSILILVAVAAVFAFGLVFLIMCKKAVKTANAAPKTDVYEFFNDRFIVEEYSYGDKTATVKFYYSQIVKRKETKSYLFFYTQPNVGCPVAKAGLPENELNTLRRLFGLLVRGEGEVKLPEYIEEKPAEADSADKTEE